MAFVLPGNARQLRFTGEAKAYVPGDETPGGGSVALGKPRVRKTTPPPAMVPATSSMTPAPMATGRPRSIGPGPGSMTPASPGQTRVPSYSGGHPSIRQKSGNGEQDMATMALDREGLDIVPGGFNAGRTDHHHQGHSQTPTRPPPPGASARSVAPIPGFRAAQQPQPAMQTVLVPNNEGKPKGAPLALWLFAAVLAGILSYHVTPAIMSQLQAPPQPAAKIQPAI